MGLLAAPTFRLSGYGTCLHEILILLGLLNRTQLQTAQLPLELIFYVFIILFRRFTFNLPNLEFLTSLVYPIQLSFESSYLPFLLI